jgi:hypothetical protein
MANLGRTAPRECFATSINVIARSPCDEAIQLSLFSFQETGKLDCFASLAMTLFEI